MTSNHPPPPPPGFRSDLRTKLALFTKPGYRDYKPSRARTSSPRRPSHAGSGKDLVIHAGPAGGHRSPVTPGDAGRDPGGRHVREPVKGEPAARRGRAQRGKRRRGRQLWGPRRLAGRRGGHLRVSQRDKQLELCKQSIYVCCPSQYSIKSPPGQVKYPPIQSLRAQVTRCEEGRLFISLSRNEYQTMEVQNNSVAITCDGLYLIYMKGSFFQEVKINLHFRKGRSPISIPTLNNGQRVDFPVVASLAFKDIVYFTVDAPDISCEHLQINDGELIIVQLTPGGFCAH